jgi:hypothetical protein
LVFLCLLLLPVGGAPVLDSILRDTLQQTLAGQVAAGARLVESGQAVG